MAMRFISAADHTGHHRFEEVTGAVTPLRGRPTDVDAASLDASRVVPFAIAGTIHADTGDDDLDVRFAIKVENKSRKLLVFLVV